jgi:tetratricopeptide (TPR) repeat protein
MGRIYQALDDNNPLLVIDRCEYALSHKTRYKTECLGIISRQYFELKRYDEARRIYLACQNSANCQWATIGLGKLAIQDKNLTHAEKLFKLLIKEYPLYLSSYDWLAITYEEQFHYIFAEEILERALQLSPRSLSRLKKFAFLCIHNEHYDKATLAYEKACKLSHNSIHHCADNTIKYVEALIEHTPSLSVDEAKKLNTKAFTLMKQMTRDFKEVNNKIQSHLLRACLFEVTREKKQANEELLLGHSLLLKEQDNISSEELIKMSVIFQKLDRNNMASQVLGITKTKVKNVDNEKEMSFSMKEKVQADIEYALKLYNEKKFQEAILKLESAYESYPEHIGIMLNLIQVILVSYEEGAKRVSTLPKVKRLLSKIKGLPLTSDESKRLKKTQKKYQLLAGI